jgi:signal transduction histidine kinase
MKDPDQSQKLDMLTTRLHSLVRHMNHQINTQIANARLLRLKNNAEVISAADVVRGVVHNYPYRSTRESDCVTIEIRHNFIFESSSAMFSQVLDNLLKNAFRSLAAARSAPQPGALSIVVDANERIGTITVRDQGIGIDLRLQARIFEPFFSTSRGTGHGLGLAFCRRVLDSVHGRISVVSAPGQGAAFILEIPRRA